MADTPAPSSRATLGTVLSGIGSSQAGERGDENRYRALANSILADLYGTQVQQQQGQYNTNQQAILQALLAGSNEAQQNATTDLAQRTFGLNAPSVRAGQAVRGSLLQNIQPATMSGGSARLRAHTPTISGGLSPSALGPGAREAGRLLEQGALSGLRSGDRFEPLPKTDFRGGVLTPPAPLTPPAMGGYEGPGTAESILGLLGGGLSAAGALGLGAGGTGGSSWLARLFGGGNAPAGDPRDPNAPIVSSDALDLSGYTFDPNYRGVRERSPAAPR